MSDYPLMFRVRQEFERPRVDNVPSEVESQLARLSLGEKIQPGQTVAITAGSRGIANIHLVIKAIVDHVKKLGGEPFIVPAMGSHGGGVAEGQRKIIEGYGIDSGKWRTLGNQFDIGKQLWNLTLAGRSLPYPRGALANGTPVDALRIPFYSSRH